MRKASIFVLALVLSALIGLAAYAAPAFETVVPEDTIAFMTMRDIPAMCERFKTYSAYDLWQEPSVQAFLEKPIARLKEEIEKAEGESGVKLEEMLALLQGQMAVAVSINPEQPTPEIVVLMDVGPNGEKAMELVATIMDKVAESEGELPPRRVEEMQDGARLVNIYPAEMGDAEPAMTYGVAGDVFLFGGPSATIKRTVTLLNAPPERAIASNPAYMSSLNRVSAESDVIGFVNIAAVIGAVNMNAPDPQIPQILGALGLNSLVSAGIGLELGEQYSTSRIFVQNSGPVEGILKLAMPQPGPLYSGANVPQDASQFVSARVEPTAIWDEFEKILGTVKPELLGMLNMQIGAMSEQIGQPIDIRRDFMSVFGPRMGFYTRYEQPYDIATSQKQVFMVEISGKAAFDQMMQKLKAIAPQIFMMMQPEDYLGYQIFSPAQQPGMPSAQGMAMPGFAATENQFLFSNQVDALKAHLRAAGKGGPSMADLPQFQAGLAQLPASGRTMISYQDPVGQVEMLLHSLKEGKLSEMLGMMATDPDTEAVLEAFDFSLLPPAAAVTKHLSPSTGCAVVGPDGLLIISRTPARAQPR